MGAPAPVEQALAVQALAVQAVSPAEQAVAIQAAAVAVVEAPDVRKITPAPNGQKIDILVPTHGRLDLTMKCIEAIYANTQTPFHLMVIDDSDPLADLTPLYLEHLGKERKNVSLIHSSVPFKCGNQIFNIGLANAQTEFVALVMNSIRVEPEWEIVGLNLLQQNPKVGLIGFKCLLPDGTIESAGIKMLKWLPTDIGRGLPSHRLSNVYEPDAVQWAFCMLRKEAGIGNLDENTFHGFRGWDDIDDSFVLKSKGWRILYCGLGVGYHEPRATRGNNTPEAAQQNKENGEAFYKRWGFWEEFEKAQPVKTVHMLPGGTMAE